MDLTINPTSLAHWNRAVPRYTSYPTAPQFHAIEDEVVTRHLLAFDASPDPLSIYIHIPFCRTMCLFCACSVILNRDPKRQADYVDLLLREIELVAKHMQQKRIVSQLHLGGGTPTSLTEEELSRLMDTLHRHFLFSDDAELSIEIDPRTVFADEGHKLAHLQKLGFHRVSFGVQDLDPNVQEAVKRRQTEEMTIQTYWRARALAFRGINIDLIYGLPLQTSATFAHTVSKILDLRPDRIALFSYAQVPWLKSHQKAIREQDLPSETEKFQIYAETREALIQGGYVAIGMDHFALQEDSLSEAYREGKLYRNFQGYSIQKAEDLWGFGVSSVSLMKGAYFQVVKTIEEYRARLELGKLPLFRGLVLTEDDRLRAKVIQALMCQFKVDKRAFAFDETFVKERPTLEKLKEEGLAEEDEREFRATPLGRLFIRLIASAFDAYLDKGTFSRAI